MFFHLIYTGQSHLLKTTLKNYLQIIASHQAEFKETLNDNDDFSSTEDFNDLVYLLLALSGNDQEVLMKFCQLVNKEYPVKVKAPRPGAKYCTIKPQFKDPRIWANNNFPYCETSSF